MSIIGSSDYVTPQRCVRLNNDTSYAITAGVSYETEPIDMLKVRFADDRRQHGINTFCKVFDHKIQSKNLDDLLKLLLSLFENQDNSNYTMFGNDSFVATTTNLFAYAHKNELELYGNREIVEKLYSALAENDTRCNVYWYYKESGRFTYHKFQLQYDLKIYDEHYPFIPGGAIRHMKDYMANKASILVLMGEPGTGKTSYLKSLIKDYHLNASVTYDDKIMGDDEFYVDFLKDEDRDVLIIEDADLLLTSRESDANKAMARILNLSDGLVNLISKKIIFTTNISDANRIDDALLRPGRCFDVVDFVKLNKEQHDKVCWLHDLPKLDKREVTLSEVFNRDERTFKRRKMGFG